MEQKMVHSVAIILTGLLNRYIGKEGIELKKIALGMEVALINITKMAVVYLLALALGVVFQTFVVHFSFYMVKRYSFGLHAASSTVCSLVSSFLLAVVPWVLVRIMEVGIGNLTVLVAFVPILLCLYLYAPADTKARPLVGVMHRAKLKKKAMVCGFIIIVITLLVPNYEIKFLLTLGAVYQCILILPLTYKILKRSAKNYEKYEC